MKKLVFIVIYIPTFLLALYLFSDNILSRIYLKNNNTKLQATIIKIERARRSNLEFLVGFTYDDKRHERKIVIAKPLINSYYVGKNITVLYNDEKNLIYLNNNINKSIFNAILYLIIIMPLICASVIYFWIFYFMDNVKKIFHGGKETKKRFEIYKQDKEHNIVNIFSGKLITLEIIMKNIDLHKLRDSDLLCYGIGTGKDFVEIYYNDHQYSIRVSKNKNEYIENIDGDIIMEYYEKVMREIGSVA